MGTSATISFRDSKGEEVARIFRQCDGMPEHLGLDLLDFFEEVKRQCPHDTRFDNPSYLAAKWVVFDSRRHGGDDVNPLGFLSVGIVDDSWEGEWHYDVRCHGRYDDAGNMEAPDIDIARLFN
jgi:hypothetical protein